MFRKWTCSEACSKPRDKKRWELWRRTSSSTKSGKTRAKRIGKLIVRLEPRKSLDSNTLTIVRSQFTNRTSTSSLNIILQTWLPASISSTKICKSWVSSRIFRFKMRSKDKRKRKVSHQAKFKTFLMPLRWTRLRKQKTTTSSRAKSVNAGTERCLLTSARFRKL